MKGKDVKYCDCVIVAQCPNCRSAQQSAIKDMRDAGMIVLVMSVVMTESILPAISLN